MLYPVPEQNQTSRVVITGAGIVTAYGCGWEANEKGFRSGTPAFKPVSLFDVSGQRVKTAGEVTLPARLPKTRLGSRTTARMERAAKLLLLAADEAIRQADLHQPRCPVVLGTTSAGMTLGQDYYSAAIQTPRSHRRQAGRVSHYLAQRQALNLAEAYGLSGPVTIIANACAAGANAIGHGWELVRSGFADRVLCGGYDALSQLVFAGFDSLQALSTTACRPFDKFRDGLALGEGAALLSLESYSSARDRGARILGEIVGYGAATDAHHLTQPHPEGDAALTSMRDACRIAGLEPAQIDYINAHGTGTPLNDSAEAMAINRWGNGSDSRLQVSSTKAGIGHLLGAAGAVEAAICVMALHGQWLPPSTATSTPDDLVTFGLVTQPADAKFEYALSNSFGFGGANATLIFRRWS